MEGLFRLLRQATEAAFIFNVDQEVRLVVDRCAEHEAFGLFHRDARNIPLVGSKTEGI